MSDLMLFVDGSVDPHSEIGYAAYLALPSGEGLENGQSRPIQTQRFAATSSSRIELQGLLWALRDLGRDVTEIAIHTDSQTLFNLPGRRSKLEQAEFRARSGHLLRNHDLYRDFFDAIDGLRCRFIKLKGHRPNRSKGELDFIFARIDKAARAALRADRQSA